MEYTRVEKGAFSVIGKEGSTDGGTGFVAALWQEANAHFGEIEPLVKRDEAGHYVGFWGLMTDSGRQFQPWEEGFSKGLYLAGAEVRDEAIPPEGWVKWTAPASEYLRVRIEGDPQRGFAEAIEHLKENGLSLVGAVYDHHSPTENGQLYMYFPIKRL